MALHINPSVTRTVLISGSHGGECEDDTDLWDTKLCTLVVYRRFRVAYCHDHCPNEGGNKHL
jgi:hypothetical protein